MGQAEGKASQGKSKQRSVEGEGRRREEGRMRRSVRGNGRRQEYEESFALIFHEVFLLLFYSFLNIFFNLPFSPPPCLVPLEGLWLVCVCL